MNIGATDAHSLGHTIYHDGIRPLARMLPLTRTFRCLKTSSSCTPFWVACRTTGKFGDHGLANRPITPLPKQGQQIVLTPTIGTMIISEFLAELSKPPVLVYPYWEALADNFSHPPPPTATQAPMFGATLTTIIRQFVLLRICVRRPCYPRY